MGVFRSLWFCAAVLLCLHTGAPAQDAAAVSAGSDSKYSLSGTVINAATSEPVRRAMVQLMNLSVDSGRTTMTDGEGRFEFNDLPPGQAILQVHKPGFFSPEELKESTVQTLNQLQASAVLIAADAPAVVLKLTPEGLIHGRVETRDGEPVEGLTIRAIYAHIANGRKQWDPVGTVVTDDEGAYRIVNLRPGTYYLAAGPGDRPTWVEAADGKARAAGYPLMFHPGVSEMAAASPIELTAGQQVQTDFALVPQPLFKISGSVFGLQKGQGINLVLDNEAGALGASSVAYNNGEFHTTVPAGSYVLRANAQGDGSFLGASMPLLVKSDVVGIRLILGPQPGIPVRLRVETAPSAAEEDDTRPKLEPPGVVIHLSRDGAPLDNPDYVVNPGNKDVDNAIRNLQSGKYEVEVRVSNPEWYVQSARCGDTNLLREELSVSLETQMPPIEIVLRNDGATLSGTLSSEGQPAPGTVLLFSDRNPRQMTPVWANTEGQFSATNLAPGDYTVVAFDQVEGLEYSNPEVLAPFLTHASHVALPANGESKVSADLIRMGK